MELYDYEKEHIAKLRKLAPECMVLLKSDGSFPLRNAGSIALYGSGARHTVKGGTGSGDVNVRHYVTVEEGLKNAGFNITTDNWLNAYDELRIAARKAFNAEIKSSIAARGPAAILSGIGAVMPEPEYDLPLDGEGDAAVYVLARISGEGSDRRAVSGDFQLTDTEIRDILRLQERYERFMLVLNVGGVVDLTPVAEKVSNILLLSQLGSVTGDAFADVLLGKAYPSGKLASTWAPWDDYCHEGDFGNDNDTYYKEGVYVGYRYFDTVGKTPLFPFGYGLCYTKFKTAAEGFTLSGSEVTVTAKVSNIGNFDGKETVQLYVSVPSGKLDQPYQVLAAFAKTEELQSGGSQTLTLSFDMRSLASFDEETACAILESGKYALRLGTDSRDAVVCGVVQLDKTVTVQQLSRSCGDPGFTDWRPENPTAIEIPDNVPVKVMRAEDCELIKTDAPVIDAQAREIAAKMTDNELIHLCTGGFKEGVVGSFLGSVDMTVAGAAGETTEKFTDRGVPVLVMADGPAGLRLSRQYGVDEQGVYSVDTGNLESFYEMLPKSIIAMLGFGGEKPKREGKTYDQYCSAIPVGTALAQSWNTEICRECGDIVGAEMERFGIHLWLAPAMNIHRMPLCGRNFEYFSEDPLISGKMAAAITLGVQKHAGCGVTIKHFAGNNQETNRFRSNSAISQRALRDIYLKGFQICIDESDPAAVMTSYNLLNGEHTSQREDLLETILREEWGYKGIVMSDWLSGTSIVPEGVYKYPRACASGTIKAGNDIMMPGAKEHVGDMLDALNNDDADYPLTRAHIEKCAARMIAISQKLANEREESKK